MHILVLLLLIIISPYTLVSFGDTKLTRVCTATPHPSPALQSQNALQHSGNVGAGEIKELCLDSDQADHINTHSSHNRNFWVSSLACASALGYMLNGRKPVKRLEQSIENFWHKQQQKQLTTGFVLKTLVCGIVCSWCMH
jgi:hypothetical protein